MTSPEANSVGRGAARGTRKAGALDQPQTILDYASPKSRVKVRLAATSVLSHRLENETLTITETLSGQSEAIKALVFGAIALMVLIGQLAGVIARMKLTDPMIWIAGGVCLAIVGVGLLVIHNTWRRTILTVERSEITAVFSAPLTPTRRYAWPSHQIAEVRVDALGPETILGELCIRPARDVELRHRPRVIAAQTVGPGNRSGLGSEGSGHRYNTHLSLDHHLSSLNTSTERPKALCI